MKAKNVIEDAKKKKAQQVADASFGTEASEAQSKEKEAQWKQTEAALDAERAKAILLEQTEMELAH